MNMLISFRQFSLATHNRLDERKKNYNEIKSLEKVYELTDWPFYCMALSFPFRFFYSSIVFGIWWQIYDIDLLNKSHLMPFIHTHIDKMPLFHSFFFISRSLSFSRACVHAPFNAKWINQFTYLTLFPNLYGHVKYTHEEKKKHDTFTLTIPGQAYIV